jgi:glycine betaine/proline transport system substrate-binding protein
MVTGVVVAGDRRWRSSGGVHVTRKGRLARLVGGALVVALAVGACNAGGGGSKGTVNIAINPWVGYEADAAVVGYLLKEELGYTVVNKDLAEDVSWQGFESGEVDVILENWGHPDLEKTYIEDKQVAVDAGQTGNVGIIGWYVPGWMVDEHPDITSWENLNDYAELFKTSESGDLGEFLGTDPSYVQYDEALIANLGLNFKVRFSGSEGATVESIKQADAQKLPLLLYWWDPHWIHAQLKLVRVNLPAYAEGCDADLEKIECDYPSYNLNKVISKKFNDNGGDAATLIKNFSWTNEDQNLVSDYITNQGMTAEEAGKKWVEENEDAWKAWLP